MSARAGDWHHADPMSAAGGAFRRTHMGLGGLIDIGRPSRAFPVTPPYIRITYTAVRQMQSGWYAHPNRGVVSRCTSREFIPDAGHAPNTSPDAVSPLRRRRLLPSLPFRPSAKDVAVRPICFSTFRFRSASLASPASHLLCPLLTSAMRSGSLSTPSAPAGRVADLPG